MSTLRKADIRSRNNSLKGKNNAAAGAVEDVRSFILSCNGLKTVYSQQTFCRYSNRLGALVAATIHGPYFGARDGESGTRILRPASEYCPKRRTVAIASKETGTHIPPSSANC